MLDTVLDVIALVVMSWGILQALVAGIGIVRFPDVLTRMHAASKPQMFGVVMVFAGAALFSRSWAVAGFLLVALCAEFLTVPASSSLVGRSAFRRHFVDEDNLVHDELSAHLARGRADADDSEGFVGDGAEDQEDARVIRDAKRKVSVSPAGTGQPDNRFDPGEGEFVNFEIGDEAGEPARAEYVPAASDGEEPGAGNDPAGDDDRAPEDVSAGEDDRAPEGERPARPDARPGSADRHR